MVIKRVLPPAPKKNLDFEAMRSSMTVEIRDRLLGFIGTEDSAESLFKIHGILSLAKNLGVQGDICIPIKSLIKSYEEYQTEKDSDEVELD